MRKLIAAVAFATLVASPAFAQSYMSTVGSGNITPRPYDPQMGAAHQPRAYEPQGVALAAAHRTASQDQLYLYSGDRPARRAVASRPSGRLYLYGGDAVQTERYRGGSGGDPNLDVQLRRESQQGQW